MQKTVNQSVLPEQENWKTTDINVESLWLIDTRDTSGKHANVYHGNFVPQIPYQLIKRYTKKHDVVLDMFLGSGTTLFECERLQRHCIGCDINTEILAYVREKMSGASPIHYEINTCDVTDKRQFHNTIKNSLTALHADAVDFIISHPPYLNIVTFTDKEEDLSHLADTDVFLQKYVDSLETALEFLPKHKYFGIVIGDIYRNREVIPLGFYTMHAVKQRFDVKLKGIVVKNIEGNHGKLGSQHIWKYRALQSDYFIFKHEYIFVFKKEF